MENKYQRLCREEKELSSLMHISTSNHLKYYKQWVAKGREIKKYLHNQAFGVRKDVIRDSKEGELMRWKYG